MKIDLEKSWEYIERLEEENRELRHRLERLQRHSEFQKNMLKKWKELCMELMEELS